MTADMVFFREWDSRLPGQRRSLDRARSLLSLLGLDLVGPGGYRPAVLTVVGSKGKGTTASYASAYLAAAGRRVVTVTSPSLRSTTERIRIDGAAVDEPTLAGLGQRMEAAVRELPPPRRAGAGYLSPSGLFTLGGLLLAREHRADWLVLEAGRGGRTDEVSLVEPAVVAITAIFGEHVAELGGTLAAVVADKAGVVGPGTAAVVLAPQPDAATSQRVREQVAGRSGGRLGVEQLDPSRTDLPDRLLPPGLGRANALLGCLAAARLLRAAGAPEPPRPALDATLGSVSLPGRLSVHRLPGTGTGIVVDAAVSPVGYTTAIGYARARLGGIDHVLLSLPDDKDLTGAVAALAGLPVTFVPVPASHLRFTRPRPPGWGTVGADHLDRGYLSGLGRVLALGTVSFVARVLTVLDVPTSVTFRHPPPATLVAHAPHRAGIPR